MKRDNIRKITKIALTCAIMCVSANIYIPLAVPITLQTLVLYFSLFFLGGASGTAVVITYLCIGAVGLPVFSGFSGGVGRLFDASGGYLIGMLVAALLWWFLENALPSVKYKRLIMCTLTLLVIYTVGTLWYALAYLGGAEHIPEALLVGTLSFILPDVVKIWIAHIVCARVKKIIK